MLLHDLCKVWILCCLRKSLLSFGSMCYVWKCNCAYCVCILKMLLYSVFVYAVRESGEESCVSAQVVDLVFYVQVVVAVWFNMLCMEV